MDKRYGSMTPTEQLLLRKQVVHEMLARTDWTLGEAVGYMRAALRLTVDELAKLVTVPAPVIEGIEQGSSTGTIEELGKLLGVLGLKLVCWPGAIDLDPEVLYRQSVPESRDAGRRIGIAKGLFEVPDDLSYPRDREWESMPDVGLEVWPTYSSDTAAWATGQAKALRNREGAKLDWDRLADEILDVAKAEERELGKRVSALMAGLAKQSRRDAAAGSADARLVREHRKLVLLQLSDCPSLEKCLTDPRWLSHCWSAAVVGLGAAGFAADELPEDNPWDKAQLLDEAQPQR